MQVTPPLSRLVGDGGSVLAMGSGGDLTLQLAAGASFTIGNNTGGYTNNDVVNLFHRYTSLENHTGFNLISEFAPASASGDLLQGQDLTVYSIQNHTGNIHGYTSAIRRDSSGTCLLVAAYRGWAFYGLNAGTVTWVVDFDAGVTGAGHVLQSNAGTITNYAGFRVPTVSRAATRAYGAHILTPTGGTTGNVGLFIGTEAQQTPLTPSGNGTYAAYIAGSQTVRIDSVLQLGHVNVAHNISGFSTSQLGSLTYVNINDGGLDIIGLTEATKALTLRGAAITADTAAPAAGSNGIVEIDAFIGTNPGAVTAQGKILVVGNAGNARMVLDAEGDFYTWGRQLQILTQTTLTTAGNGTYTAAQLFGGVIRRDCNGASRSDTTDTAANIIATAGLGVDGMSFECVLVNVSDAAETITIIGGSGVSVWANAAAGAYTAGGTASQTLAQHESAILKFVRTSATTVDLHIIGA